MKILILGGTGFIGPHEVDQCEDRGWKLSIFNRGRTQITILKDEFRDVERLYGDRDPEKGEGLNAIRQAVERGRTWDAVIDNSGYVPRIVRASAELLKNATRQYLFVSTVSVYKNNHIRGQDESSETATLEDAKTEKVDGATYGPLKAACEKAVIDVFADRATIVRPGLIVGPGDPTDRFTYWPVRCQRGGNVLIPEGPRRVQYIDVRDLAGFLLDLIEGGHGGIYNAVGPLGPLYFKEMVDGCKAVVSSPVTFIQVSDKFLQAHDVKPWMGPDSLAMWIPRTPETDGFAFRSNAKAVAVGLTYRPLADTAKATLDWFDATGRPNDREFRAGPSAEREAELLAAWQEEKTGKEPATPS